MKAALLGAIGVALLAAAALAASVVASRPAFDDRLDPATLADVAIAAPADALTFARAEVDGRPHVLLVTQYRHDEVVAVDLTRRLGAGETSPLPLLARVGYDALAREAADATGALTVDVAALDVPFDAPEQNIGVGLNYREHARESALDEQPFLFPKFAVPTRADSSIARGDSTLLDYEAELGLVALEDIVAGASPRLGLVLANEVTDRWALVRGLDRSQPMGTTGFADGKSREGFAPIGPLLVVPRDLDAFYPRVELALYVNGRLRQRQTARAMLWGPRQIVAAVFERAGWPHAYRDGTVPLLADRTRIPVGTVIFSGTPAGVIFRPVNLINPWVYLRPGDDVVVRADALGVIRNRIVP